MRTPWPHLLLFLAAIGLALVAGASAGPAGARSRTEAVERSPGRATPGLVKGADGRGAFPRVGSRFGATPERAPTAPGGGPRARDATPPPLPRPPTPARWMGMPVAGVDPQELPEPDVVAEHGGLDIPAARGTPVLAVARGTIQRVQESAEGGHTVHVLDESGRLRYYYAHLQGYAEGLEEGQRVRAGEPIGYVGDSGDAVPGHTHVHFAVFPVDETIERGRPGGPVDPLPYLLGRLPLPR